jgi:hypothetical protein
MTDADEVSKKVKNAEIKTASLAYFRHCVVRMERAESTDYVLSVHPE